jgi:hypothetical protein
MHMKDYTVEERRLTDEELREFRKAMEEDGDDIGVFRGVWNCLVITAATVFAGWMIYTLIQLPGIP